MKTTMLKAMEEVSVGVTDEGQVYVEGLGEVDREGERDPQIVRMHPEQVPLVIQWLDEAAGGIERPPGPKRRDIEAEKYMVARLLQEAVRDGMTDADTALVYESMLMTLQWILGETDRPPDDWWLDQTEKRAARRGGPC